MSKTVDQRVVEMRFDNGQFERNAQTSISTLDKLKQSLNFKGATKGLESVETAAKHVNLSPISNAVEGVRLKFSALEVMGVTALTNITNSALNAGKRIVAAFTIDPIKTGFQEYETQINAVQTILANTSSKGTTLDDVNAALDELNTYADKTIYNFTEMTRNIGTFTAAGIDLKTSVSAIQGIANLAAVSGSTSQQASTAMYQLSQALSSGTVKLMDWNSVVNAGMGGEVFQNALKETSRMLKTGADEAIKAEGSFRESLKTGWITSEVLTETLKKFTTSGVNEYLAEYTGLSVNAVSQMREQAIATGDSSVAYREMAKELAKSCELTDDQIYQLLNMSTTAEDAATKVKTFTQLMDTLKEAAQSGWTQTWELIVGDFNEAKSVFTELSDFFGKLIGDSSNARNAIVKDVMTSKWDQLSEKITETGVSTKDFQDALKETAKVYGINVDKMIDEEGSFQATLKRGWATKDIVIETLERMAGTAGTVSSVTEDMTDKLEYFQSVVDRVWNGDFGNGDSRVKALTNAGYEYAVVQDLVNKTVDGHRLTLEELSDVQLEAVGYTTEQINVLRDLAEQAKATGTPIEDLIANLSKPSGRELLLDSLRNTLLAIDNILTAVKEAWAETFSIDTAGILYDIIDAVHSFSEGFLAITRDTDNFKRTFKGLFAIIDVVATILDGAFKAALEIIGYLIGDVNFDVTSLTACVGDSLVAFRDWVKSNGAITKTFERIVKVVKLCIDTVRKWINEFMAIPEVQTFITNLKESIAGITTDIRTYFENGTVSIGDFIDNLENLDGLTLENVGAALKGFWDKVVAYFTDANGRFAGIGKLLEGFKTTIEEKLKNAEGGVLGFFKNVYKIFNTAKTKITNFFAWIKNSISNNLGEILVIINGIAMILVAKKLWDVFSTLVRPIESFCNIMDNFAKVLKSTSKLINASSLLLTSVALINIALAITILAGALALLSNIPKDKLWNAVGVIGVLTLGLVALAAVVGMMQKITINGEKSTLTLVALAGSVMLIAGALLMLDSLKNPDKLLYNTAILTGVMFAMGALAGVLGVKVKSFTQGSLCLVAMASSIVIFAKALSELDKLNPDNVLRNLGIMALAMVGMITILLAAKGVKVGTALSIIAIPLALMLLAKALIMIGDLDLSKVSGNLVTFIVIFGLFVAILGASKNISDNIAKAGVGILGMAAALVVISIAMKILGGMPTHLLTRALLVVGSLLSIFIGIVAISVFAGEHAAKAGVMLLLMSAAILILTASIAILSHIDPDGMKRALGAIAVISTLFAALIAVTYLAKECKSTLIILTVTIGMLTIALGALSMIDRSSLMSATVAMSAVMGMMALLVAMTNYVNVIKTGNVALLILVGVVVAIGGILYLLGTLPKPEVVLPMAAGISLLLLSMCGALVIVSLISAVALPAVGILALLTLVVGLLAVMIVGICNIPNAELAIEMMDKLTVLILAMSAACLILVPVGALAPAAIAGIGMLALMVVAIGGLLYSVAELLTLVPGLDQFIVKGIPLLLKLSSFVGEFAGNLIGGFVGGLSSGFAVVGTNLANFMTNAKPFFDGAASISPEVANGMKAIADTILILTAADIITGISKFIGLGDSSFSKFGEELKEFGPALRAFSDSISGGGDIEPIDAAAVESAANAAKCIAEFARAIPNQKGLLADLVGDNTLSTFGLELKEFGPNFKEFAESVDGLDVGTVEAAVSAAKSVAAFADTIPNEGGCLGFLVGDNTLSTFGYELFQFGPNFKTFAESISGIDNGVVNSAMSAARAVTAFADTIPNEGGCLGFLVGDNTLSTFGYNLSVFGPAFKTYYDDIKDIDPKIVEASSWAASSIVMFANMIEGPGLFDRLFPTEKGKMAAFGESLVAFGESFKEYSGLMGGVYIGTVQSTTVAASAVVALDNAIKSDGGLFSKERNLEDFGKNLVAFGKQFTKYYDSIKTISSSVLASVTEEVLHLVGVCRGMTSINMDKMGAFGSNLVLIGSQGIEGFIAAFTNSEVRVTETGRLFLQYFINGIKKKETELNNAWVVLLSTNLGIISGFDEKYYNTGSHLAEGFAAGITKSEFKTTKEISAYGNRILDKFRDVFSVNSPSKELEKIGMYCGEGFNIGIDNSISGAKKGITNFGSTTLDSLRKALGVHSPSTLAEKIATFVAQGFDLGILDSIPGSQMIAEKFGASSMSSLCQGVSDGSIKLSSIQEGVLDSFLGASSIFTDAISNAQSDYQNTSLESAKQSHQDVVTEENRFWYELLLEKRKGIEAEKYQEMSFVDFQKDILEQTKSIWNKYTDEVTSKKENLFNGISLFSEVQEKDPISSTNLLNNMRDQIKAYEQFDSVVIELNSRIKNDSLRNAINEMGVGSLAELEALNKMTDGELDIYVSRYEEKYKLCEEITRTQTASLKKETEKDLSNLFGGVDVNADEFGVAFDGTFATLNRYVDSAVTKMEEAGGNLTKGIAKGMTSQGTVIDDAAKNVSDSAVNDLKKATEINSPSALMEREVGTYLTQGVAKGMTNRQSMIALDHAVTKSINAITNAFTASYNDFYETGGAASEGFKKGILDKAEEIGNAAAAVAQAAFMAARRAIDSNSPSKKFMQLGQWADEGFAIGLTKYSNKVDAASEEVGYSTISSMKDAISQVVDVINSDLDTQPTIRPVLDLSDISDGTKTISSMFSRTQALSINARMNADPEAIQNGAETTTKGNTYQFTQNNYSPKALARTEIYRHTKNQFSAMERMTEA